MRRQIQETVRSIKKLPVIKRHIENSIHEWSSSKEHYNAANGMRASKMAQERILFSARERESNTKKNIEYIIKSEPDALHAMNLYRLLTKNWAEYPNAYKICSKIPKNKEKRLMDILYNTKK